MKIKLTFFSILLILGCSPSITVKQSYPTTIEYSEKETDEMTRVTDVVEMPVKLPAKAKNIILLIGDGTGVPQITAGMYSNDMKLPGLERFKVIGLHKNHASNNLITDSAAGATAFSCGEKTFNGAIGVAADSSSAQTILEEAELKGLSTGLVATSEITHATPASFIAHNISRGNGEEIAADFLETEIDYFVGGGLKYFSRRDSDDRDLSEELRNKGYMVSDYFTKDFGDIVLSREKNFAYFTSDDKPLPAGQGRDYLKPASLRGVEYLNNKSDEGFFMMIEASQIDWGGHANDLNYVVTEMLEFDEVINAVLDFAEADGQTLVIVTADHECGGLTINYGSTEESLKVNFASTGHTNMLIPVFAYGPGAEAFGGIYDNTEIYQKMRAAYGWGQDK